jgi:hypothetical protein
MELKGSNTDKLGDYKLSYPLQASVELILVTKVHSLSRDLAVNSTLPCSTFCLEAGPHGHLQIKI